MFQSETYQSVDRYYRNVRNLEIYDQLPDYGKGPIITKCSILDVAAVQDPTLQKLLDIWWVLGVFYFSDAFMEVHLLKYMFLLTLKFFDSKIATKMTAFNFFFFFFGFYLNQNGTDFQGSSSKMYHQDLKVLSLGLTEIRFH